MIDKEKISSSGIVGAGNLFLYGKFCLIVGKILHEGMNPICWNWNDK